MQLDGNVFLTLKGFDYDIGKSAHLFRKELSCSDFNSFGNSYKILFILLSIHKKHVTNIIKWAYV